MIITGSPALYNCRKNWYDPSIFEIWNNPFYAESKWELNKKELDYLQKEEKLNEIDEDINVDL